MAWNNGDGSDVIEGGSEVDVLQVNGSTAADQFTVNANGARLAVARTSPGPFTLDVGGTEALVMAGSGGDDGFTLGSLVGVAQVSSLQFSGLDGNDQFALTPIPNGTPRAVRVNGGLPFATGDSLSLALGGVSNPILTLDANGSGSFTSSSHQSIDIISIESAPTLDDPIFRNGFE